jgi:hypothetical protein
MTLLLKSIGWLCACLVLSAAAVWLLTPVGAAILGGALALMWVAIVVKEG